MKLFFLFFKSVGFCATSIRESRMACDFHSKSIRTMSNSFQEENELASVTVFGHSLKMKLKQLKVRPKKILEASPCIAEMGALFECWATAGVDDKRCAAIAKSLTLCMGKPVQRTKNTNTINYHLARLSKQL